MPINRQAKPTIKMDSSLLDSFELLLQDLNSDKNSMPEGEFLGSRLWLIKDGEVTSSRLKRLNEIIPIEQPLLIGCKSNLFWKDKCEEVTTINVIPPQVGIRKKKKSSNTSVNETNSSVCGSPLKLDVIADLSGCDINDSCIQPMGERLSTVDCGLMVKTGRKFLSVFSTLLTRNKDSQNTNNFQIPMVVLLTDGKHCQPLSCMGVKALIDKQNNVMGLKTIQIISEQAAEQSTHRKNVHFSFGTTDVTCMAKYDLLLDTEGGLPGSQNALGVVLEWKRSEFRLIAFTDPPVESRATVNVQVTSGNCRSPAFGLFQEMEILKSLIKGLTTSEVDWIGTQERPLVERVEDLIEQLKHGSDNIEYRLEETASEEFMLEDLVTISERKDFDFTDHLWKVLQNCTSYSGLVEAFTYIISVMKSGDLQPFLAGKNNTVIAMMVRDSFKGQLRMPSLVGLLPIEYLAEMGILKLTRDYVYLLISKNLATLGSLEFFINETIDLEKKLVRLQKLHNILEVVLLMKHCLNLPQASLADCTTRMLKHYEKNGLDRNGFSFKVSANDVSHVPTKHSPIEWKAEGFKMINTGRHHERTAYIFTAEQPLDWIESASPSNKSVNNTCFDDEETPYFLTIVKENVCIV